MLKHITVDQIMEWRPCGWDGKDDGRNYTRNRVTELFGKRKRLRPLEILDRADIPAEDRLWVILRPEIIAEKKLHELACQFAFYSLHIFEKEYPDDKRPRLTIEAKKAWLRGEITDEELAAARAAAWAAEAAAWATEAAARATEAASWAAEAAAWATEAAARGTEAAARGAAWAAFLEMTRKVLNAA